MRIGVKKVLTTKEIEMSKPFKETVEERAKRDPEFRKELELEMQEWEQEEINEMLGSDDNLPW